MMHPREVQSRHRRPHGAGARRQQKLVVGQGRAVGQDQAVGAGVDLAHGGLADLDPQLPVMVPGLAQIGSRFLYAPGQVVGDGHPRIGRLGLFAEEDDLSLWVLTAQRFRRDHTGRAGTDDDVTGHVLPLPELRSRLLDPDSRP